MIKSMTGFGRAQASFEHFNITVEIKSVNHRYFEFSSRVPRGYSFLEDKLKSAASERISRGKVECYVTVETIADDSVTVTLNEPLARGYVNAFSALSDEFQLRNDVCASVIARFPDVLTVTKTPVDEEEITDAVLKTLNSAIDEFIAMRACEGAKMRADVLSRADLILENVSYIEKRSPETVKEYNDKLLERMKDILGDTSVDEARLLTEAAIFADKIAVAEETVRLRSHIDQLRTMLDSDDAIGRKLDFLVQEINRESNTIGSKAQNVDIARRVIDIKAEVEKIREQIQNIE